MSDQIQKPRRRILNAYVLFWVLGATFAATYLAVLGTHPDMFASAKSGPDLEQQLAQTQHDVTRAFADLDPLKESVGQIKADVATLKTAQQQSADRDQLIMEKVSSIESAATLPKVAQAETAPAVKQQTAQKTTAGGPKASEEMVAVEPDALKPQEVAIVAPIKTKKTVAPKAAAIETGSIAHKDDKTPAAAAVTAAKPAQAALLLGSAPTVDAVKLNWSILNDRHADAVRNLHPRYVPQGKGAERSYALLAGPVASPEQAKTLCKLMVDRGLACEVSTYRGTAF